jgi:hypothetical protein
MRRIIVNFLLSMAMLLSVAVGAEALPQGSQAQWMNDSAFERVGDYLGRGGVIPTPVIPPDTPMRNPRYPSVPLPPPSTAITR